MYCGLYGMQLLKEALHFSEYLRTRLFFLPIGPFKKRWMEYMHVSAMDSGYDASEKQEVIEKPVFMCML